jgi:hypothetical protein
MSKVRFSSSIRITPRCLPSGEILTPENSESALKSLICGAAKVWVVNRTSKQHVRYKMRSINTVRVINVKNVTALYFI